MMVRILAHQSDPGNGIGLHYRRFQRYSDRPTWPNQLLAPARSRENRPYRPPIREDGLSQPDEPPDEIEKGIESVVVHPVSGVVEGHHPGVAKVGDPAILLRVRGPALAAVDEQDRAGYAAP